MFFSDYKFTVVKPKITNFLKENDVFFLFLINVYILKEDVMFLPKQYLNEL